MVSSLHPVPLPPHPSLVTMATYTRSCGMQFSLILSHSHAFHYVQPTTYIMYTNSCYIFPPLLFPPSLPTPSLPSLPPLLFLPSLHFPYPSLPSPSLPSLPTPSLPPYLFPPSLPLPSIPSLPPLLFPPQPFPPSPPLLFPPHPFPPSFAIPSSPLQVACTHLGTCTAQLGHRELIDHL